MIKATFLGYGGGRRTRRNKQALIKIDGIENDGDAASFIGRKVVWKSESGGRLVGKIVGIHGKRGVLRAWFRKGLPGQAIGSKLDVR